MPISLVSTSFLDQFGNTTPSYKSNAGDLIYATLTVESSIRVSSIGNSLQLDPSIGTITWNGGDWMQEGFRVGDTVVVSVYNSSGSVLFSQSKTAMLVTTNTLDLDSTPPWFNIIDGEFVVIEVLTKAGRGDLIVSTNHVSNINGGSEFSLIDGEASRVKFNNVNALNIGVGATGSLIGNQSGQYIQFASITRLANNGNARRFSIEIRLSNSGIYDQSWFASSDCLKLLFKLEWGREPGDLSNLFKGTFVNDADSGWFNESFNSGTVTSSVITGISELDYKNSTTHTVKIGNAVGGLGIGASYIPLDETYYKNKVEPQQKFGMLRSTIGIGAGGGYSSEQNPSGAGYAIQINSITTVGSDKEINLTFQPSTAFFDFMEDRDEGDRLFYIWVKCGSVNHLVYSSQLEYTPPPGDPLTLESEIAFTDHSQNVDNGSVTDHLSTKFNTEDDLGFYGTFLLDKNKQYSNFVARIEAFNGVTSDDFTLLQATFDFSGVPISSDGRYLLGEVIAVNTALPLTSLKREAKLKLEPSLDTSTKYGVSIYFPFLLRWEYWLNELNASVDFWPNQNKNWFQYDNTVPWEVRLELALNTTTVSHLYNKSLTILNYDSEVNLSNDISLKVESTNQVVGIVVENEIMRVTATHTILNGKVWNPSDIWGMITVEPFESAPRWIVSTAIPTDGNVLNPLSPISGSLVSISFPSPEIAKMECFFDPSKINLTNGVKFTSKIKGCPTDATLNKTTSPDDIQKTTTFGDNKTLA